VPSTNWLECIRCPNCGNDEAPFIIDVRCRLHTYDDQFKNEDGCWIDDGAYCECTACGYSSRVVDFREGKTQETGFSPEELRLLDVDATDLFEDESPDWKYCIEYAAFSHREACEFMLYIGDTKNAEVLRAHMNTSGCSQDFLALVELATNRKAVWLMLHA